MKSTLAILLSMSLALSALAAGPIFTGQVIGDPDAATFVLRSGITTEADQQAIVGFVKTLKQGGAWTNLVDALILKTNLGAGAVPVSFFNRTSVVAGLSYNSFGGVFDGSSTTVVLTNLPDCRTNTLMVVEREPAVSQYANLGARTMVGLWGGYQWGERISSGVYFNPYYVTNGVDSGFNGGTFLLDYPGPGGIGTGRFYACNDGYRHVITMSSSSNYVSAWWDMWWQYANSYYGYYPQSQPLTNLYVGAQPTSGGLTAYHTGEISAVLVFNRVLTTNQVVVAEQALRWLESGNENVIVLGDSTAAGAAPLVNGTSETPFAGWPSVLTGTGRWQSNVNFHVISFGGLNARGFTALADDPYIPVMLTNVLRAYGLGGPVSKLTLFLDFGHNDRGQQADSLAQSQAAMTTLCAQAKAAGAEVWVFTTPYAANGGSMWWSAAQEAIRQQENRWLRANPSLYDHLVDRDLLFTVSEANNPDANIFATGSLAGVHLAAGGNLRLANAIIGQLNGVPLYNPTYATDGSVISMSRGALLIMSNSPAYWPASPPWPGASAFVNSNGFNYVLQSTNGSGGVSSSWTGTNKFMW